MMDKSHDNNFFSNPKFVREMRIRAQQLHQLNSVHLSSEASSPAPRRQGYYSSQAFKRDFFREISRRNQPAVVAAPVAPVVPIPFKSNDSNSNSNSNSNKKVDKRFFFCDRWFVKEMRVQAQKMHQENKEAAQNGFFDCLESRKGQCVVVIPEAPHVPLCSPRLARVPAECARAQSFIPLLVSTVAYYPPPAEKKEEEEVKKEKFFCSRPFVRELRVQAQKMHRENSQAAINGDFDRLESRKGQCVVIGSPLPPIKIAPRVLPASAYLPPVTIVARENQVKFFCSRPFVRELRIRAQQMHQANVRHLEAIDLQRNALNKTGYFCSQGFKRDLFAEIKKREIEMNAGSSSSSSSSSQTKSDKPRYSTSRKAELSRVGYFRSEGFKKDLFSTVQKFEAPAPVVVVVDNSSASSSSSSSASVPAARSVSDILRNEVDRQVFMDNLVKMKAMGFADGMVNARALLDANNDLSKAVLVMAQRLL